MLLVIDDSGLRELVDVAMRHVGALIPPRQSQS
jgi:hypothetical protein